jgi:hypothetical protein
VANASHFRKQDIPILVTDAGMQIVRRDEQFSKTCPQSFDNDEPGSNSTVNSPPQFMKHERESLRTEFGMQIDLRVGQF